MFHNGRLVVGKVSIIYLSRIRIFYVLEDLFAVACSSGGIYTSVHERLRLIRFNDPLSEVIPSRRDISP